MWWRIKFPYKWLLVSPFLIYAFGSFLNVLVITANKGIMPVMLAPTFLAHFIEGVVLQPGDMIDDFHRVMLHTDHLKFLADWIQIPHLNATYSPGDIFIDIGDYLIRPAMGAWLALLWRDHNARLEEKQQHTPRVVYRA